MLDNAQPTNHIEIDPAAFNKLDEDCFNRWNKATLAVMAMAGLESENMDKVLREPIKKYREDSQQWDSVPIEIITSYDQLVDEYNKAIIPETLDYRLLIEIMLKAADLFGRRQQMYDSIQETAQFAASRSKSEE